MMLTLQHIEIDMKHENESLVEQIAYQKMKNEMEPLKSKIKKDHLLNYFNYGLNTNTWNILVNKQIYMIFEVLHIEQ